MVPESVSPLAEYPVVPGPTCPVSVEVDNVSKAYSRRRWLGLRSSGTEPHYALRNVSFTVQRGELLGLLGPNGAGKTTLLKSIATLLSVSAGRILVDGRDLNINPIAARRAIGLVTCDERSFYWRLTGRQNLCFFAALYRVPSDRVKARVDSLLEMLSLSHAGDSPYHSYSSGMRQKLAIARGLLSDPRLILYDEPTRSLDPLSAQSIREWIIAKRASSPDTTHVIATNQLHEAEQLCDRVVILNRGTIIADGSVDRIRARFATQRHMEHCVTYSGAPRLSLRPSAEMGLIEVDQERTEGELATLRIVTGQDGRGLSAALSHILGRGGSVVRCETRQLSFDDVFCSLVSGGSAATEKTQ